MQRIFFILAAVVATSFLGNTAQAEQKVIAQVPITKDWFESKVRWNEGPPSYTYRWKVSVEKGVVILCGAGYFTSGTLRSQTQAVLRNYTLHVDGVPYLQDMSFFAKGKRNKGLIGTKANCVSTGKAPPKKIKDGVGIWSTKPNTVYR